LIVDSALRVGDLVTPATKGPSFQGRHGFGVIISVEKSQYEEWNAYVVKFTKSQQVFTFAFDGLVKHGQD